MLKNSCSQALAAYCARYPLFESVIPSIKQAQSTPSAMRLRSTQRLTPLAQHSTPRVHTESASLRGAHVNSINQSPRTLSAVSDQAKNVRLFSTRSYTDACTQSAAQSSTQLENQETSSASPITASMPAAYHTDAAWQDLRTDLGFTTTPAIADSRSASQTPTTSEKETLLYHLWTAQIARSLDETQTEWTKGRIPFAVWGAGQELAQTLMVAEGPKFMSGYYRDLAGTLASGATNPQQVMAQVLGDTEPGHDPASGGRMMGSHFGDKALDHAGNSIDLSNKIRIASRSSSLASQMPAATGIGAELKGTGEFNLVMLGDATCAEGLFWESLNQMAIEGQPTVVMVLDNDYGITVPGDLQVTHGSISQAAAGLSPALKIIGPVNGWDYDALQAATHDAAKTARTQDRPVLLHVKVTRPFGHSSTGGTRAVPSERLAFEQAHDCIEHFAQSLQDKNIADAQSIEQVRNAARSHAETAAKQAWADYYTPIIELASEALSLFEEVSTHPAISEAKNILAPKAESIRNRCHVDAPSSLTRSEIELFLRDALDVLHQAAPTAPETRTVAEFINAMQLDSVARWSDNVYAPDTHSGMTAEPVPPSYPQGDKIPQDTQAHIISAGLSSLLQSLPELKIFGEDTGKLGGVSTCTLGLQSGESQVLPEIWKRSPALQQYIPTTGFGQRVFDTGIAEAFIVGKAIGRAHLGKPSVPEIQYLDYMPYALQQLIDEAGPMRHRTAGGQETPFLVRTHGHRLLGMWHSGSPMGMLMGIPGLRILTPRNGTQAVGLYRSALEHGHDPAVAIESLSEMYTPEPVPDNLDEITIPLGASEEILDTTKGKSPENQCTVVTYGGASCKIAQAAAERLAREGVGLKVIDLQTLSPLDTNHVARDAIRATGKVLWLDEDYPNGAMAMIAKALLHDDADTPTGDKAFYTVEAERFLTARPHKPAYGKDGGHYSKPQTHDVVDAVRRLLDDADGGNRTPAGILSQEEILAKIK